MSVSGGMLLAAGCSPSANRDQAPSVKANPTIKVTAACGPVKLTLREFDMPMGRDFTISRGTKRLTRTLVVELAQGELRGYGESPESAYYSVTRAAIRDALAKARPQIEAARWDDPADFWKQISPALIDHPFAQCALDEAAHDLWGKRRGQPVWKLWGLDCETGPPTDYTIGIDPINVMVAKMQELPGWPIYKIKLGTPHDIEIVQTLRRHTTAVFRVDANGGWTVAETLRNAPQLKELGVEFIEQPVPPADWSGMKEVFARSALPLVADEAWRVESDVDRCRECFHGINIKLPKCGGLTPARRMIARARQLGLKLMMGSMSESSVGISAIAQARPMLDYVDMDGALLLKKDIAAGVTIRKGHVCYPAENGCGVRLLE
jgi:L-alanine-DL-glutamate epimerase-like enolase superfamily enzyme